MAVRWVYLTCASIRTVALANIHSIRHNAASCDRHPQAREHSHAYANANSYTDLDTHSHAHGYTHHHTHTDALSASQRQHHAHSNKVPQRRFE